MGRVGRLRELPDTLAGREAPPARRSWVRWVPVAVLASAAVVLSALVVASAVPHRPALRGFAAPVAAAPASTARAVTATPGATMLPAQAEPLREELTALADRLPSGVALHAPSSWAHWAGAPPSYARDVDGCPHLARRLGALLGGRWTYVYGTLPQGGCTWVPVPWIPDQPVAQRFFLTVEFEQGPVAGLLQRTEYCAGGRVAPRVAAPQVPGAVLSGCDDAAGPGYRLALPDTGGSGVWFLSGTAGVDEHAHAPGDGLLALLTAATAVFS